MEDLSQIWPDDDSKGSGCPVHQVFIFLYLSIVKHHCELGQQHGTTCTCKLIIADFQCVVPLKPEAA